MTRGKLILLEGLDRTGKSTQAELLIKKLEANSSLIKFPERTTPIGKLINAYLTDKNFILPDQSIHLLFSANRWELMDQIKKSLNEGNNIVLDRYVFSGIAYSAAKNVNNMNLEWCLKPDIGLIKPDITIFLTNSASNESRDGFGEERYENVSFQNTVRGYFDEVFNKFYGKESAKFDIPIESEDGTIFVRLDVTGKTIEEVSSKIDSVLDGEQLSDQAFRYF